MGRMPLKGWLMLMLGASRAPLNETEARAMGRGGKRTPERDAPPPKTVVVPRPASGEDRAAAADER